MPSFRQAVITIGTFDGVHTGHQQIIRQLKQEAALTGGETVIISFHPHPRKVIGDPQKEIRLINTLDEKIELLDRSGIDHFVIIPFTLEFAHLEAEAYIRDFLIRQFHPATIIIGYDHRFGKDRKGDYHLMEAMSPVFSYKLCEIPVHVLNAISVSSTSIRQAISAGEIEKANTLLGYSFFFEGRVQEGQQLGRKLGFPTANLQIKDPEKLLPADGVYAVHARLMNEGVAANANGSLLGGMMNIGFRPTLEGKTRQFEVHLFNFSESIYGRRLRVSVEHRLRSEIKFSGLEELKAQLARDRNDALRILGSGRSGLPRSAS